VLGQNVRGTAGAVLDFLALVNSIAGNTNAEAKSSTRLMYAMGRVGDLPRWLGQVHPQWRTPHHAIFALMALSVVVALIFGLVFGGPENGFAVSLGAIVNILLISRSECADPFAGTPDRRHRYHARLDGRVRGDHTGHCLAGRIRGAEGRTAPGGPLERYHRQATDDIPGYSVVSFPDLGRQGPAIPGANSGRSPVRMSGDSD
jgi:hypothetical protein